MLLQINKRSDKEKQTLRQINKYCCKQAKGTDKYVMEDKLRQGHWLLKMGYSVKVPGMEKIVFLALT